MNNYNTLDFSIFDPVKAGETWAVDELSKYSAVEIYIDGKKLLDTIREIELPYAKAEGHPHLAGSYGHVSPYALYDDLKMAADGEEGYPFCCEDCGEPGCWSVTFKVREDADAVAWYHFKHEHRDWKYDLTYRFEKEAYAQALEKLREMALSQKSDELFQGLPLKRVIIDGNILYQDGEGLFYRLDIRDAYVAIECADNEDEARRGIFDDADLFDVEGTLEETFRLVRKELEKYSTDAPYME